MSKTSIITVQGKNIALTSINDEDYISLTDMVRSEDGEDHIRNWMRNKNTIEFLGIWESLNNPDFKGVEFDTFLKEAGLNRFNMTPRKWIDATNAIGIISRAGRNGGTYAHKDIAIEFASWISPTFKLYLIKEYQRLISIERGALAQSWDVKRLLSKTNYHIHTDAIKNIMMPRLNVSQMKQGIIYADEADVLNLALFGCTAKQWQQANPELAKKMNIRDTASINQLIVLSNIESQNAELIKQGLAKKDRLAILHRMVKEQLSILEKTNVEQNFRRLASKGDIPKLIE